MFRIKADRKLRDFGLHVDIAAENGDTLILMGNNGSGKTTVLNMVTGLMSPDAGTIEISGSTVFDSEKGINVPPESRDIGYVFQNYALFPHLSVYDNVAFGLRMRKTERAEIDGRVKSELESVGMWDLRNEKAARLSGGQKQKVALARALVIKPGLLLLDEPFSSLDVEMQASLRIELSKRLKQLNIPGLIVTHSIRDATELGNKVCVMDRGMVTICGSPDEVFRKGRDRFIDNFF